MSRAFAHTILMFCMIGLANPLFAQPIIADHHAADRFDGIPAATFDALRSDTDIFYGHTSHGSQIVTGIQMLAAQDGELYAGVTMAEYGSDLGTLGYLGWVAPTRAYLDSHPACNWVLWSWCGGVSTNTEAGIDIYLAAMTELELDYPAVTFVYMTGHLDGTGPDGNLYQRNNQIRAYCAAHDKVLFDFADIESFDPAGTWYPDDNDSCQWCANWCAVEACPTCGDCAHSHCFNCYRKGRAFWWMLARVAGWPDVAAVNGMPVASPRLQAAWPNPCNPSATIVYELPEATAVRLQILDSRGRFVVELDAGQRIAGRHEVTWPGRDAQGHRVASGSYFYRLETAGGSETRKVVLLK